MKLRFAATKSAKDFFKFMRDLKISCTVTLTNYTGTIKTANNEFKYLKEEKNPRIFIMGAIIKKDIKERQLQIDFEDIPHIDAGAVDFYLVGNTSGVSDSVIYIDLKNAYPTILKNQKFITQKTLDKLNTLKKTDKLTAIGMLASKKTILKIEDGEIKSSEIVKSAFEKYFFYCARYTQNMMHDLSLIAGKDFIFSWVDCIYLDGKIPPEKLEKIKAVIKYKGFDFSYETGTELKITEGKKFHVRFISEKGKEKIFNFPKQNSSFAVAISAALAKGVIFVK